MLSELGHSSGPIRLLWKGPLRRWKAGNGFAIFRGWSCSGAQSLGGDPGSGCWNMLDALGSPARIRTWIASLVRAGVLPLDDRGLIPEVILLSSL